MMAHRGQLRALGLILMVPFLVLALLPTIGQHSDVLSHFPTFKLAIGDFTFASLERDLNNHSLFDVSSIAWIIAGIGEILLVGVAFFLPSRISRYRIY